MTIRIPNTLTKKQIEKFKQIYNKIYDVEISNHQATKEGLNIIEFIAVILDAQ